MAVAQHILGLSVSVGIYVLCLRMGLPRWLSTAATVPSLFDAWEITTEQMLLSETLFIFALMAAFGLLVWWRSPIKPPYWALASGGLLLGLSADLRSSGVFLIVPLLAGLLVRRSGWRRVAAASLAFVVPLLGYAGWFDHEFGWFGLTPGGLYAYGRVVTFADCSHDSLSRSERLLCPTPAEREKGISWLIWSGQSPYQRMRGSLHYKTTLAEHFAVSVVVHQPGQYLSTVFGELRTEFSPVRRISVPDTGQYDVQEKYPTLQSNAMAYANLYQHGGNGQPRPVHWVAKFFRSYQLGVHVPGMVFLAGMIANLIGFVLAKRSDSADLRADLTSFGGAALLLLTLPILVATFDYRYLVPALPPLSVATALAVQSIRLHRLAKVQLEPSAGGVELRNLERAPAGS